MSGATEEKRGRKLHVTGHNADEVFAGTGKSSPEAVPLGRHRTLEDVAPPALAIILLPMHN
jgi:hypothetical protein